MATATPWGANRLALYPNVTHVPCLRTEIDPETQSTRYRDTADNPITLNDEGGAHGTGTTTPHATATSADGGGPRPPAPSDSDLTEDSDSD